jgi:signal transduction histidine kinase
MEDLRLREFVALVREVRHDVNGPLTSALGNVQMLLDEPALQDPEVRDTLREVESELRRLAAMVLRLTEVEIRDGE